MSTARLEREATIDDLYSVEGNAELVDGRLMLLPMTGDAHGTAVLGIATSLKLYQRTRGGGRAYSDGVGFIASPRRSFSPDVAWYVGPRSGARLLMGVPVFAVEIRSPEDYGPSAERRLASKRATTSRRARMWSGMSTCSARASSACTGPTPPNIPRSFAAARRLMRRLRFPAGGCRWMNCSSRQVRGASAPRGPFSSSPPVRDDLPQRRMSTVPAVA